MNHNRIVAFILLVFVFWWGYLTTKLPETTMIGEPGPKFFPFIILLLMGILSILLFLTSGKKAEKKVDKGDNQTEEKETFPMRSALSLFGVFFVGIVMVYFLGFNLGMIIGLTTMLSMIGWKIFPKAILFSALVTLSVYFLFSWLLRIPLPTGSLF